VRRLVKYLKPYTPLIILAVILLFVQANADLALPDYLSRIVNNGIQQGGVENAVPLAIRQSQMDRLLLFVSEEDQAQVLESYVLVEPGSAEAEQYIEKYPALADTPVYVRQDLDRAMVDSLNTIMGRALLAVSGIERALEDPSQAPPMGEGFGFDLSLLPQGVDVFVLLEGMPASLRTQMTEGMAEGFDALGDSMVTQMAVAAVKAEYEALGMDTAKDGCRRGARYPQGYIRQGGELFQRRVRRLFNGLADHPRDERRHTGADGDLYDHAHGLLRTHHRHRRHHPGHRQEREHVVAHRRGRRHAAGPDPDRLFHRPAQVPDHAEPDRPLEPGDAREPVGHDGGPGLQQAG
jgi:hypothetical protein